MTTKAKKNLFITVKIIILLATLAFLYLKLGKTGRWEDYLLQFRNEGSSRLIGLLIAGVALLPVNLGIEARKWQFLTRKIQRISFTRSVYAIFSGITLNLFTPFNLGDYAARTLYLEHKNKLKGALFTFISGFGQLIIKVILGLLSLPFYFIYFQKVDTSLGVIIIILLSGLLGFVILWGYYNVPTVFKWVKRFIKNKKIGVYIRLIEDLKPADLRKILWLSCLRFLVYCTQFYFFLMFFGIDIPFYFAYPLLCLIFFTQSLVPSFALVSLGVRGAAAIYFIGLLSDNQVGILAGAFSLWLVNFILAGLVGLLIIFSFNFVRGVNR